MSAIIDISARYEFLDAATKAERLRDEPPFVPPQKPTPEAARAINALIDALGPIQVIGGARGDKERLDVWFPPTPAFAAEFTSFEPNSRNAIHSILNNVVSEFSPGRELTRALAEPDQAQQIAKINDLLDRYLKKLVELGSPTPAQLIRKRIGLEGWEQ